MNYYIADLHLGHKNIIHMCKRPFQSVEEMDNTIIDNCNNVAGENDDLYVIGDFCYRCPDPVKYISRFNARVHLITGNHDIKMLNNRAYSRKFASVQNYLELMDGNTRIVLPHYPMAEWNGYWREPKILHLYGHIHNNINNAANIMGKIDGAYNVGADLLGFAPRTLQ